jgi:hypothetical protein
VKANANFRKEKFEQQHAVPRFDEQKCFIWAWIKLQNAGLQLIKQKSDWNSAVLVSEAEIKRQEMGTPS